MRKNPTEEQSEIYKLSSSLIWLFTLLRKYENTWIYLLVA